MPPSGPGHHVAQPGPGGWWGKQGERESLQEQKLNQLGSDERENTHGPRNLGTQFEAAILTFKCPWSLIFYLKKNQ